MENMSDQKLVEHEWCSTKAQINGSLCHITASFGMAIAGIVINGIIDKAGSPQPEPTAQAPE